MNRKDTVSKKRGRDYDVSIYLDLAEQVHSSSSPGDKEESSYEQMMMKEKDRLQKKVDQTTQNLLCMIDVIKTTEGGTQEKPVQRPPYMGFCEHLTVDKKRKNSCKDWNDVITVIGEWNDTMVRINPSSTM